MSLVFPQTTIALINAVANNRRHPGLQLDKLSVPGDQTAQKTALATVCSIPGDPPLLTALLERRKRLLGTLPGALFFSCQTNGPLTLHLARASALENAGICLHPLYGFAYLPGSGLKGMARAYAETVWLPAQTDQKQAWRKIEDLFGWAPGSDQGKDWKPNGIPERAKDDRSRVGSIVFHDAWPVQWPKLLVDIVNNHHPSYYRGEDAPGDWDSPNPVYFLAVTTGTAFEFALAKRRTDVPDALLVQAREWLDGGLTYIGAGAKTAAGYGSFVCSTVTKGSTLLPNSTAFAECEITLELATPAFLAGAGGQKDDCDLRPATIRGLLRWWWRAMHAGFVAVPILRRLEAAVWGDTTGGGAVRVEVAPLGEVKPRLYDKQAEARKNLLPRTPDKKTTQGLWYNSYGMHDAGKQRHYLPPETKWKLVLRARDGLFVFTDRDGKPIPSSARRIDKVILLDQARVALWWLCMVGGVGSKARKGFGNFCFPSKLDGFAGGRFVSKGKQLREACGLTDDGFKELLADSPALRQMVDLGRQIQKDGDGWVHLVLPTSNIWQAIDEVGMAAQMFAKKYKHQREKALSAFRVVSGILPGATSVPVRACRTAMPPRCITTFIRRELVAFSALPPFRPPACQT